MVEAFYVHIKDDISFSIVSISPGGLEIIFASILLANNRRVCFRYFLQTSLRDSGTLFNIPCPFNSSLFSNLILLGDFNVNYLDPTSSLYTLLHSMISSFDLAQVVQEPTRVIDNEPATLIDLALFSNPRSAPLFHLSPTLITMVCHLR